VIGEVKELYDYAELRTLEVATMFVPRIERPLLVLGSRQSTDLLDDAATREVVLRRRRGGGGLVLLRPGDVWVDWWVPANDESWSHDVHASSLRAGRIWRDVVAARVTAPVSVHEGSLEGEVAHRVVCFAGKGPGEVFVGGRKAVGVTQWRVREGVFLSTVLPAHNSRETLAYVRDVPAGLDDAFDHDGFGDLASHDTETMLEELHHASGAGEILRPDLRA
jgi:lipoate-protein ligase A